ncbi:DUF1365 domain-containing protein [Chthonobacter rhizosphaerae]|uniref:DUF1365 domain-containing protein n=1 Tax=Chthonobacter rhizosphaerae TaxID=2735553 RepID=UPI0015EED99D|nr:DUF1365 domain-containing protein [Chthonobacter rhizosphaerae]
MTTGALPTTTDGNGPAPVDPAVLYVGSVMHARLRPLSHRFTYRVANLLVDLDRLAEADRLSPAFSVGRFNLFSFREADHGPRDGTPLRAYVDRLVARAGAPRPARVLLLCYPRVLGFVFNPISVYFCLDEAGRTTTLIYEVRNTFGESHTYVAAVEDGEASAAGIRQERDKLFYVSPFMPMDQRYHFRVLPPGDGVRLRILETDRHGPTLAATFAGERRALTARALARTFAAMPLHTLKVVAGIHYEAAVLWLKGAPYFSRGAPPPPVSYRDPSEAGPVSGALDRAA